MGVNPNRNKVMLTPEAEAVYSMWLWLVAKIFERDAGRSWISPTQQRRS